jgi:hypothetical protein
MRRVFAISFVVFCMAAGSAGAAVSLIPLMRANTDLVSLRHGRGTAILKGSGTVIGTSIARGSIKITDLRGGARTRISVSGYERVVRVSSRTKIYSGRNMTFGVYYGRWRVRVRGRGINVSAAVRGRLTLRGIAGTYAINDGAARAWPRRWRTISLG